MNYQQFINKSTSYLYGCFGHPDDWALWAKTERPSIWKYGDVEYHFDYDGNIWFIMDAKTHETLARI